MLGGLQASIKIGSLIGYRQVGGVENYRRVDNIPLQNAKIGAVIAADLGGFYGIFVQRDGKVMTAVSLFADGIHQTVIPIVPVGRIADRIIVLPRRRQGERKVRRGDHNALMGGSFGKGGLGVRRFLTACGENKTEDQHTGEQFFHQKNLLFCFQYKQKRRLCKVTRL